MNAFKSASLAAALAALVAAQGCGQRGPSEEVGARLDRSIEAKAAKGPAEKAGEKLDDAARNADFTAHQAAAEAKALSKEGG